MPLTAYAGYMRYVNVHIIIIAVAIYYTYYKRMFSMRQLVIIRNTRRKSVVGLMLCQCHRRLTDNRLTLDEHLVLLSGWCRDPSHSENQRENVTTDM